MPFESKNHAHRLTGHALRNAHLRERSLARAQSAPPLARLVVEIRAKLLGLTRLEFARRSGLRRGTLRDMELGIHIPTRRILQHFVNYCRKCGIPGEALEDLRRLYAGPGETLEQLITRLELQAGSPRELARRVGISSVTLWEYRRGNFPVPWAVLQQLCKAVGVDPAGAEALWCDTERRRFQERGYPEALAEFWVLCSRKGLAEKHLLGMGLSTATVRRLRYLGLPAWNEMADVASQLCRDGAKFRSLHKLWERSLRAQQTQPQHQFGMQLKEFRQKLGMSRRDLADLFGIGGKKPARIVKYIEEDGFYSAQAYPAGLVAVVAPNHREELLRLWEERRKLFHRRHRPETRIPLRLAREMYGFDIRDMKRILGYSSLQYQRIERGVTPMRDSAIDRIREAIHLVGLGRVEALLQWQSARQADRTSWQTATTVPEMILLLAKREGGMIPLTRFLRKAGLKGLWTGRLRAITQGEEVPAWPVIEEIGKASRIPDVTEIFQDWSKRFRSHLQRQYHSPLTVELRLLIAESARNPRAFSPRLGFNYSVLIRDLQRIDCDEPIKWFHVERILRAAGQSDGDERWKEIRALWYTAKERKKRAPVTKDNVRAL